MEILQENPQQFFETSLKELSFIWLEITGKCNLTCTHCYADSSPTGTLRGNMSYDDWIRVIEEAAELGCSQLQFIGGEPTLHPDLQSLIRFAKNKKFNFIEVFTNATRLNESLIECMKEYDVQVAASFYSDEPKVHDGITDVFGSWEKTVKGFHSVVNAGLPLRVGIIEMKQNEGHINRATTFLKSIGVENIGWDRLRGVGRGEPSLVNSPVEKFEELCGQCWNGKLCVAPTGDVFPCVFSRATPLGNAKQGILPILESKKLHRFRKKIYELGANETPIMNCVPTCLPVDSNCTPNCGPSCGPSCGPNCGPNCFPSASMPCMPRG